MANHVVGPGVISPGVAVAQGATDPPTKLAVQNPRPPLALPSMQRVAMIGTRPRPARLLDDLKRPVTANAGALRATSEAVGTEGEYQGSDIMVSGDSVRDFGVYPPRGCEPSVLLRAASRLAPSKTVGT